MGVQLGKIISGREIEKENLTGKKIAIDAYNWLYQFLSIIRDRETGEPLRDSKGRITSHLSGLFYRTSKLIESGIKPVWVFDGKPPEFKRVVEERKMLREQAEKRLEEARKKGDIEEIRIAAQQTAFLTEEMIEQSKNLLKYMGVPFVQAPSEGEAQCAWMCKNNLVFSTASQDFDSLLFGSPNLIRNLSITGRRKISGKNEYIQVKPELIELRKVLNELNITREQLIIIGLLIGTDYNPGIKGIGPKTALKIIREEKNLESILKRIDWNSQFNGDVVPAEEIYEFFLNPSVTERVEIKFGSPDKERIIKMLVDEFDFSQERIEKTINSLEKAQQKSLENWFKK